ncbi:hypothetical protein D3C71_1888140 [compost metagenome]
MFQLNNRSNNNFENPPDHQREKQQQRRTEEKSENRKIIRLFQGLVDHIAQLLIRTCLIILRIRQKIINGLRVSVFGQCAQPDIVILLDKGDGFGQRHILILIHKHFQILSEIRFFR